MVALTPRTRASKVRHMLYDEMDAELIRMYADEVAWLTARLNRRTADMDALEPE